MSERKIVIYETSHHENLPALFDLCEDLFDKTAVFLKELSYRNINGKGNLTELWPKTSFFVQTDDCPNRSFIHQTISFLKKNNYTHLHLSTLDNNLLYFSAKLLVIKDVHISLTVHEVNEYFTYRYRNIRDITESIAKKLLHYRIRHYSFFLPAMTDLFQRKYPGSTTVFIPSRFYSWQDKIGKNEKNRFKIVIPGSVESNRRDYDSVVDFFRYFLSQQGFSHANIELVVLGNCNTDYGLDIIARLKKMELPSFKTTCYETYIPQTDYERQLSEADLIWSPLQMNKASIRKNPEINGQSTASGLTADLLLYCTPALIPHDYVIPYEFKAAMLTYRSREELKNKIIDFINDPEYLRAFKKKINQSYLFFSKKEFAGSFKKLMGITNGKS
ncbi:glycosyltransferase family protein [Flavitalea flava]